MPLADIPVQRVDLYTELLTIEAFPGHAQAMLADAEPTARDAQTALKWVEMAEPTTDRDIARWVLHLYSERLGSILGRVEYEDRVEREHGRQRFGTAALRADAQRLSDIRTELEAALARGLEPSRADWTRFRDATGYAHRMVSTASTWQAAYNEMRSRSSVKKDQPGLNADDLRRRAYLADTVVVLWRQAGIAALRLLGEAPSESRTVMPSATGANAGKAVLWIRHKLDQHGLDMPLDREWVARWSSHLMQAAHTIAEAPVSERTTMAHVMRRSAARGGFQQ